MRHFLVLIVLTLCFVTKPFAVKAMAQQAHVPVPAASTAIFSAADVAKPEVKPRIAVSIIKSTTFGHSARVPVLPGCDFKIEPLDSFLLPRIERNRIG